MRKTDHIGDLIPDPKNPRSHPQRNIGMIVDSLHETGAHRSIVIDENNVVLAGNGVLEAAALAGIEKVKVIEADGETIIAVRRSNLTDEQKRRLTIYDNRAAELAEWNPDVLNELKQEQFNLDGIFNANELAMLTGTFQLPDDPRELWGGMPSMGTEANAHRMLTLYFKEAKDVEAFAALIEQTISESTKSLWFSPKK